MTGKLALVVGANGLVGSQLVHALLQNLTYAHVTVLVRRPLNLTHPRLDQRMINFDQINASYVKGDDVFCCLGTTLKKAGSREAFYRVDCTYPLEIARLARQNGAAQYLLVTALGADPQSSIFYNRVKGEVEQKIASLEFPTFCVFRPSLLLGQRQEFRLGEKLAQGFSKVMSSLMVGSLKQYKPIEASKVATAMVAVAQQNLAGKHIFESEQLQPYPAIQ